MIHVIVLAAGIGSRLKPHTDKLPKCLLPVGGKSLLARNLDLLFHHSNLQVTVVTGYLEDKIKTAVKNEFSGKDVRFVSNSEYNSTNNAFSLALALKKVPGPFALMDGDLILDKNLLDAFVARALENLFWVDSTKGRLTAEAMKVRLQGKQIAYFSKNIPLTEASGEYIGLASFGEEWGEAFCERSSRLSEKEKASAYYEDICNDLIAKNRQLPSLGVAPVPDNSWMEIDTPEDWEEACKRFR